MEEEDRQKEQEQGEGEVETAAAKATRLKTLAEQKYNDSNLKSALKYAKRSLRLCPDVDGTAELVTAFKILRAAVKSSSYAAAATIPEWYKILQVEPFSHINAIKKQYKKLALILHPDKNPSAASEEAFKLVGEAFRVLSDKIRRKEYDVKLRIAMQVAATEGTSGDAEALRTFWTACSTCRLLHQFERRYLGHNLMCPSCKKSFKAVEVSEKVEGGEEERTKTRASDRVRLRFGNVATKRKMSSVGDVLKRADLRSMQCSKNVNEIGNLSTGRSKYTDGNGKLGVGCGVIEGVRSKRLGKLRTMDNNERGSRKIVVSERLKAKRLKTGEELMTLAEMQMLVKRKASEEMLKLKEEKEKEKVEKEEKEKEEERPKEKEEEKAKEKEKVEEEKEKEKRNKRGASRGGDGESQRRGTSMRGNSNIASKRGDLEIMVVEDSDFYDFDKDRIERSFRKGQVWAIYDDDDGMPRHYGLIDEVISVNPFEVKISWLDLQNNGNEGLICWEKMGFHICCGRFKVSRKTLVNSLNIFSHVVDCDRAARELYRIYPKKGSVWALYKENALDAGGSNLLVKDKRCYDIVVFLTSYSEIHGLSMAYLEKVDGFKTVFKRSEVGFNAIKWLEKDDVRLFSHQIPARKLSGEEISDLGKECWELDPASLPPELLTIGSER